MSFIIHNVIISNVIISNAIISNVIISNVIISNVIISNVIISSVFISNVFKSIVVVSQAYYAICPFTVVTKLCFSLSCILFTSKARAAKSCTTKLFFQILKLGTQNLGRNALAY
jgi:hypothetical protein